MSVPEPVWSLDPAQVETLLDRWNMLGLDPVPRSEVERYYGRPILSAELGCTASHFDAWARAANMMAADADADTEIAPFVLVLEDDVVPFRRRQVGALTVRVHHQQWAGVWHTVKSKMRAIAEAKVEADLVYFGRHRFGGDSSPEPRLPGIVRAGFSSCSHAYCITRRGADRLHAISRGLLEAAMPIDDLLPALCRLHPRLDLNELVTAVGPPLAVLAVTEDLIHQMSSVEVDLWPGLSGASGRAASVAASTIEPEPGDLIHAGLAELPISVLVRIASYLLPSAHAIVAFSAVCRRFRAAVWSSHGWRTLVLDVLYRRRPGLETMQGRREVDIFEPKLLRWDASAGWQGLAAEFQLGLPGAGAIHLSRVELRQQLLNEVAAISAQLAGLSERMRVRPSDRRSVSHARLTVPTICGARRVSNGLASFKDVLINIATSGEVRGRWWRCMIQGAEAPPSTVRFEMSSFLSYCQTHDDLDPIYLFEHELPEATVRSMIGEDDLGCSTDLLEELQATTSAAGVVWGAQGLPSILAEREWVVAGPAGSGSRWHTDPCGTAASNVCLAGSKLWCFYRPRPEPGPNADIPPGTELFGEVDTATPLVHNTPPVLRWFRDWVHLLREPAQAVVGQLEWVVQRPGDVILVPAGVWHTVLNLEDSVAYTRYANASHH